MNINLDFSCKNLDFSCINTPGIKFLKKDYLFHSKKDWSLTLLKIFQSRQKFNRSTSQDWLFIL
jgi:hypothetical protein